MNEQMIESLQQSLYRDRTAPEDKERIFRLRYQCYRAEGLVADNERASMFDAYDEAANCVHVAIEANGQIQAAMRLHLLSSLTLISPTLDVFPELLDPLGQGQTALDPTRFVIEPSARKMRVPLHFLALRIPFLAAMHYNNDLALASVRTEHIPFYRRYLNYELAIPARPYHGLKKPLHLLTAKFREQRDAVLARTPVFGPMPHIPHANISFPDLSGVYLPSKLGHSAAA